MYLFIYLLYILLFKKENEILKLKKNMPFFSNPALLHGRSAPRLGRLLIQPPMHASFFLALYHLQVGSTTEVARLLSHTVSCSLAQVRIAVAATITAWTMDSPPHLLATSVRPAPTTHALAVVPTTNASRWRMCFSF
jgi:hypothetical protein